MFQILNALKLSTKKPNYMEQTTKSQHCVTVSEHSAKIGITTPKLVRKELATIQEEKLKEKASKSG